MEPSAQLATTLAREAIAAVDLRARVAEALELRLRRDEAYGRARTIRVVAVGKAAPIMTLGALDALGARASVVRVLTAEGTDARALDGRHPDLVVLRGAHPIPDARSVAGGEALLAAVAGLGPDDLVVALVSGGASSLAAAPPAGLALETERAVEDALLRSGAQVSDVNVVRRHLSRVRGGGLARAALPARTCALIASDVLVERGGRVSPGAPWDVGSGPATPDPTTIDAARAVLARFAPEWLPRVEPFLATTFADFAPEADRVETSIVASPIDLAEACAERARAAGLRTEVLDPSLAPVDALAPEYAARARALPERSACVRVAEPSVSVPDAHGRGGRAGRLALLAWSSGLPDHVALACVASDGVDGGSGAGGAVITGRLAPERQADARRALEAYDDAPFLAARGAHVAGAPTGTNLLDLHVLVRA